MKKTWRDGDHHILPKKTQKKLFSRIVNETTIHVTGEEHVKLHQDIREIGPYGTLTRHEIRKALGKKDKQV